MRINWLRGANVALSANLIGRVTTDIEVEVDKSQIRLFALATGWSDAVNVTSAAAMEAGHRDVMVPPTMLFGLQLMQPEPFAWLVDLGVDLKHVLHVAQSFEFHRPAYAGDRLRVHSVISGIDQKKGGLMELIECKTTVTRAQEPVATLRQTIIVQHRQVA